MTEIFKAWNVDRRDKGLTKEGFPRESEKVVFEKDLPQVFWDQGQTGMVGKIIKPIDQTGIGEGQVRIIVTSASAGDTE